MDNTKSDKVVVNLPQLFTSFLAQEPTINPYHERTRTNSENALSQWCSYNKKQSRIISKCNASYFMAVVVPDADASSLKVLYDWVNWVFPYDDMFDGGCLSECTTAGQSMADALMQPLLNRRTSPAQGDAENRNKLLSFHDTVWFRMQSTASKGSKTRFVRSMRDYADGVVKQVEAGSNQTDVDLEEMLSERRRCIGILPVFALAEYALQLDLPDHIVQHPLVQEISDLSIDLICLHNDILSYPKEESENWPHNVIASCRSLGMSAQQSFDHVGNMVTFRMNRLTDLVHHFHFWNPTADNQLERYINIMLNTVKANLYWSFMSGRYFGAQGDLVRQTGQISVQRYPAWLEKKITPLPVISAPSIQAQICAVSS